MSTATSINRLGRSIHRLTHTHYPSFLLGFRTYEDALPAFVYHDVEEDSFRKDLIFLRENGYATLTTEEYVFQKLNGNTPKAVLLTFDDARRNFRQVAFPLLQEFNAKATLFVPTRWITPYTSEPDQTERLSLPADLFMNWDEIRFCAKSGLVDIQSHAHRHALVYASPRLVGFSCPSLAMEHDIYDWPMRRDSEGDVLGIPPLGTPIYSAQPLLSAEYRLLENDSITHLCQEFVAKKGGTEFFSQPDWPSRLHRFYRDTASPSLPPTKIEHQDFLGLVRSEFLLSQKSFQRQLGFPPKYFAYPWMLGSALSLRVAPEFGIRGVFGVAIDFRRARHLRNAMPAFGRIKGDWLRFLPGHGRMLIRHILPVKVKRFFGSQHLAH